MDSLTNVDERRRPRLRVNPDVTVQRIGDDAVLIDLGTNEIYEMNRTSARMWELLAQGLDVEEIERRLGIEFEIGADALKAEMDRFLTTLLEAKLVVQE